MMFMAYVSDKNQTRFAIDYDSEGKKIYQHRYFTMAVSQFRPIFEQCSKEFSIKGKDVKKACRDPDIKTRINGQNGVYFNIKVPHKILEDFACAVLTRQVPASTILDLRVENWDNLKTEYKEQTGPFAYRALQRNTIK